MRYLPALAMSAFATLAAVGPLWAQAAGPNMTPTGPRLMAVSPNTVRFPHYQNQIEAQNGSGEIAAPVKKRKRKHR